MDSLYLHLQGIDIFIPLIIGIGFCVGFFSGLMGVGGGWLITPALSLTGLPMTVSIGTSLTQMIGTSLFATFRHRKGKNTDFKLGVIIGLSMIVGLQIGKELLFTFANNGISDSVARVLYVIVLGGIGSLMFRNALLEKKSTSQRESVSKTLEIDVKSWNKFWGPTTSIVSASSAVPWLALFMLGSSAGVLSGLMGIGGGFILVPSMIYLLGVDTIRAVATNLICILVASSYGAIIFTGGGQVDFYVVLFLLCGSFLGSYVGVAMTRLIDARELKILFSILVLMASLAMALAEFGYTNIAKIIIFSATSGLIVVALSMAFYKKNKGLRAEGS
ncbi:MAG: sulfite exporter TauE/SafE family protein [Bdellovibrionota bacterium]